MYFSLRITSEVVFKKRVVGVLQKAVTKSAEQGVEGFVKCLVEALQMYTKPSVAVPLPLPTAIRSASSQQTGISGLFRYLNHCFIYSFKCHRPLSNLVLDRSLHTPSQQIHWCLEIGVLVKVRVCFDGYQSLSQVLDARADES